MNDLERALIAGPIVGRSNIPLSQTKPLKVESLDAFLFGFYLEPSYFNRRQTLNFFKHRKKLNVLMGEVKMKGRKHAIYSRREYLEIWKRIPKQPIIL